ncbi:MAG: Asp-tRNA(Asn)/Glu-tRNA(Gln) amidotransferase subunit GatB [Bacillota bacterium]
MTNYETIIGLEVHVELITQSKLFCGCANRFGAEPNTLCCPTCLGLPGSLPVLNQIAVEMALRAALALNCTIAPLIRFDRKHYFYPDLPRGYQITQYTTPIGSGGFLEIETPLGVKKIGIARVHLEDDAGKLVHSNEQSGASLVDYNRSGVPLIEIVTTPNLHSPQEARIFLDTLKNVLQYLDVSDCKMQEGSLRCDANLSLRPEGTIQLGVKTELKNVNSFRNIERGLEYERQRQQDLLLSGGTILAETRRWDDGRGVTLPMRVKEESQDYRYFPEPDLPATPIGPKWIDQILKQLPELPAIRYQRLLRQHHLTEYEAGMISRCKHLADFCESVVAQGVQPKAAVGWLLGEVSRLMNARQLEWEHIPIRADDLALLIKEVNAGRVSTTKGKELLALSFTTGEQLARLLRESEVLQISDQDDLRTLVAQAIANNDQVVAEIKAGKERALMFLIGQVIRLSRGRANPTLVNELLRNELGL